MADISQTIKDLLTKAAPSALPSSSISYSDDPNYKQAIGLLQTNYGYTPQMADFALFLNSPLFKDSNARSKLTDLGFGSQSDVEKNFGGYSGLGSYLLGGGSMSKQDFTGATNMYGENPAYQALAPTGGALGSSGGVDSAGVSQLYSQYLGREATPQELQTQTGNISTGDLENWLKQQKWEGSPTSTPGGLGLQEGYSALATPSANLSTQNAQTNIPGATTTPQASILSSSPTSTYNYPGTQTGTDGYKDFLSQWLEGYGKKQEAVTAISKQVQDVETLLNNLEKNINSRISENSATGGVITEAQRARYNAVEGKPLREQLTSLTQAQSQAQAGLSAEESMLPYYQQLYEYQSPQEKYAQELKMYEDKMNLEKKYEEQKPGIAGETNLTLDDIWRNRPDLQAEFSSPTAKGKSGNWTLQDWFNRNGRSEYPGVFLEATPVVKATGGGNETNIVPGEDVQLYSGLDSKTATAVRAKAGAFKSEPIVTNFNVINEGYAFAKSIPDDTTSASDDQAMIYAFAKIMDPNSVVREGEYATVQKYAQSWADSFGFNAKRIFSNSKFLSETAIKNMKATLERKYQASKKNYDNTYSQYIQGINNLTGRSDGDKFITDYSGAYNGSTQNNNQSNEIWVKDRKTGKTGTIPAEEYDSTIYEKINEITGESIEDLVGKLFNSNPFNTK